MTTIPEAAVEAAADAARRHRIKSWSAENYEPLPWNTVAEPIRKGMRDEARAAVEAAMPAIREAIAQEIKNAIDDGPRRAGLFAAARIVRGLKDE